MNQAEPVNILLIEDNPGDVLLIREALRDHKIANSLRDIADGETALAYLRGEGEHAGRHLPELVLLDLNLPRLDGREVLAEIKADPTLKHIPVVIMTSSAAEADILRSYRLQASCYVTKPLDLDQFLTVVRSIEFFYISVVRLPRVPDRAPP